MLLGRSKVLAFISIFIFVVGIIQISSISTLTVSGDKEVMRHIALSTYDRLSNGDIKSLVFSIKGFGAWTKPLSSIILDHITILFSKIFRIDFYQSQSLIGSALCILTWLVCVRANFINRQSKLVVLGLLFIPACINYNSWLLEPATFRAGLLPAVLVISMLFNIYRQPIVDASNFNIAHVGVFLGALTFFGYEYYLFFTLAITVLAYVVINIRSYSRALVCTRELQNSNNILRQTSLLASGYIAGASLWFANKLIAISGMPITSLWSSMRAPSDNFNWALRPDMLFGGPVFYQSHFDLYRLHGMQGINENFVHSSGSLLITITTAICLFFLPGTTQSCLATNNQANSLNIQSKRFLWMPCLRNPLTQNDHANTFVLILAFALLFCTAFAFGDLFAVLITPQFRSLSRVVPFIYVSALLVLQPLLSLKSQNPKAARMLAVATASIVLIEAYYSIQRHPHKTAFKNQSGPGSITQLITDFSEKSSYYPSLKTLRNSSMWIAPYRTFPENNFREGSHRGFGDYEYLFLTRGVEGYVNYPTQKYSTRDTLYAAISAKGLLSEFNFSNKNGFDFFVLDLDKIRARSGARASQSLLPDLGTSGIYDQINKLVLVHIPTLIADKETYQQFRNFLLRSERNESDTVTSSVPIEGLIFQPHAWWGLQKPENSTERFINKARLPVASLSMTKSINETQILSQDSTPTASSLFDKTTRRILIKPENGIKELLLSLVLYDSLTNTKIKSFKVNLASHTSMSFELTKILSSSTTLKIEVLKAVSNNGKTALGKPAPIYSVVGSTMQNFPNHEY